MASASSTPTPTPTVLQPRYTRAVTHGFLRLWESVAIGVLLGCAPAAQQPVAQTAVAPSVRVQVRLRCDGPCQAIERSCETACDHMGYDPTPGHDQQHCRDECFDNESECVRDCEGS